MGTKNINQLGVVTSLANDDKVAVWDTSAAATKGISISNLKTVINGDYLTKNGGTTLTGNWDIGTGRHIAAERIRARSSAGLRLEDDAGNLGIFIKDSTGYVGFGTADPLTNIHVVDDNTGGTVISIESTDTGGVRYIIQSTGSGAAPGAGYLEIFKAGILSPNRLVYDGTNNRLGVGVANPLSAIHTNGAIRAGYDTDTTSYLGRAAIGYDGTNSDHATFCHIDNNTDLKWALRQYANGQTRINAASGQYITMGVAGNPLLIVGGGSMTPVNDNSYDVGDPSFRFDDIYATNGTIQTSDERQKIAVADSDLGLDFIHALRPVRYVWRSTEEKTHTRPHYGLIAQEVRSAMEILGIADFAGFIHSETEESDAYGLRYTEFIAPIIKAIQELAADVEALKQR